MGETCSVLDDGWFGKADDDKSGLGDWKVNRRKLGKRNLRSVEEIHKLGLELGIWIGNLDGVGRNRICSREHQTVF